jgi:SAM-dependent methyltransferase
MGYRGSWNSLIHSINLRLAEGLTYRGRVIDLGCGACPYKEIILRQADEYIGVDWTNSAHGGACVDVFADLAQPLPFPDEHADTIVAFQVLEHLPEPARFLAECNRVLREDGTLILVVPFMWHVHEAPHDFYRFTRYGLEYLLTKAGFAHVEVTENSGFWQTWVLKFNYYTRRLARGPLRYLFAPVWWLGQAVAPALDRLDPYPEETASYTAQARKHPSSMGGAP